MFSRSAVEQYSPAYRAAKAKERIEAVPELGPWEIRVNEAVFGQHQGLVVTVNGAPIIGVLSADLDPGIERDLAGGR